MATLAPAPDQRDVTPTSTAIAIDSEKAASDVGKDGIDEDNEKADEPYYGRRWLPPFTKYGEPESPCATLDEASTIPDTKASFLSMMTFYWIQPTMSKGYKRPLQAGDLWALDDARSSSLLADQLLEHYESRRRAADAFNARLDSGEFKPTVFRRAWWKCNSSMGLGRSDGRQKASLPGAISDTFYRDFWSAGLFKVVSDGLMITSPLVTKALIEYGADVWFYERNTGSRSAPSAARGYGLAVGLFLMQVIASLCLHQFFARAMSCGVLARGALITAIYRRAVNLSSQARYNIPPGKLVTHISTDVSRIDFCMGFFHISWSAPIQLMGVIAILVVNLGPSALAGVGLMIVVIPLQARAMRYMFSLRVKTMVWTDKRAKLIQELLNGIKILKFFAWENAYLEKLRGYRLHEMTNIRSLLITRSATMAIALSMPLLGSVLAFLTYSAVGHSQDPAKIFTALTLFNMLRIPLMMLPVSLGTISDGKNACNRLEAVFDAELASDAYIIDEGCKWALQVDDGEFKWEGAGKPSPEGEDGKKKGMSGKPGMGAPKKPKVVEPKTAKSPKKRWYKRSKDGKIVAAPPTDEDATVAEKSGKLSPVTNSSLVLRDISLRIERGSLTAIVGPVGSGKSSLLQAMISEMRRLNGSIKFGGSVGYCQQTAWIQNSTLRDNILFGKSFDEERYWKVISDACLESDLKMLPGGDMTEIGEKGVTLSGGQKQRVAIARALYFDPDVLMLDDPLSAVDAHVGQHLFDHAILGTMSNGVDGRSSRTRILVTHALHFLPKTDYIICMDEGKITESGTYEELMKRQGPFYSLVRDFAGTTSTTSTTDEEKNEIDEKELAIEASTLKTDNGDDEKAKRVVMHGAGIKQSRLMQVEERATGTVGFRVYGQYFGAAKGWITVPLMILFIVLQQACTVLSSYWLVWWQEDKFNQSRGFYMVIYAAFGVAQTFAAFFMGVTASAIGYYASQAIHHAAARSVLHAPQRFFDTQPLGRIMNRFVKDIDTIDNTLNDALRMVLSTFGSVAGSVILIAIVSPWFLIAVVGIFAAYYMAAKFYRSSARDFKRLDNLLRSSLYAHFSESLSGLATIRAYGESSKFVKDSAHLVDVENRAYLLTVINQRWLGIRLDFLGALLVLTVALIGVGDAKSINPSKIGLILTYVLTMSSTFSWMVRQAAEVENDFNSVERLFYYGKQLEQEGPSLIEATTPDPTWPAHGKIEATGMIMAYRPGLPNVLKGVTFSVQGGEKIGIVGRTGSGKSSLMMALLRMVELSEGRIDIDGVDASTLGLTTLRRAISIIPQEAVLFNGTIRTNLDPFGQYEDVVLWDALKRAGFVDRVGVAGQVKSVEGEEVTNRYSLDSLVEDEGQNLSVGERALVSLARALVKQAKIIVLDEATASVDFETDARIQETIKSEFGHATLLCIAHRLKTIMGYDRIMVMDDGLLTEFDSPIALYDERDSLFRGMCDRSSISRDDVVRARLTK